MHPVIFTLISLVVPILTVQPGESPQLDPPILRPPVWPPPARAPYYWGDMLNITKCYCVGSQDTTWGHYYQFDYHNYHNEQQYRVAMTCDTDFMTTAVIEPTGGGTHETFVVPECWNAQAEGRMGQKEKKCVRSPYADIFCFELGNAKDPEDHYYFNEQKGVLPDFVEEFPPDQCVAMCRDKVHGKAVASGTPGGWEMSMQGTGQRWTTLRSSFKIYTALHDMDPNYHHIPPADK